MNAASIIITYSMFAFILSAHRDMYQENISEKKRSVTEWILTDLTRLNNAGISISGKPENEGCKYGNALFFNGTIDGIFLEQMPLDGLEEYTIEVIMRPAVGGNFEQRFFHCGEVQGNRVLLEIRSNQKDWYLDAYIKTGDQQKTMADPNLVHPLDKWFHIAFIVDHGKLETYINGKKELESQIELVAMDKGKTSIGVRLDERSWYKGAIYKVRISPVALTSENFMNY
jgi:hypothetical protein